MASEMAEDFKALRAERKERHNEWYKNNSDIIRFYLSPEEYTEHETVFLVRTEEFKADFYPHTGRWKYKNKMYRGGARKFLQFIGKELNQ